MLSGKQIRKAIDLGTSDAMQACQESGSCDSPADGWDGWLINSIGGTEVAKLAGLKSQEGEDWQTWLLIYHHAAQSAAEDLRASLATEDHA